jgi:hypothetical protein
MSRPLVGVLLFRLQEARRVLGDVEQAAVLARWLIRREYLVTAKDLREGLPTAPPVDGVRWRPLDDADIPLVVATRPTLGEAEVRHRLAEAQQCWVGWVGTRPVHWRWEADADVFLPYLGRRLRPNPGERWVVDVYTDPAYRGRGLDRARAPACPRARPRPSAGNRRLVESSGAARHAGESRAQGDRRGGLLADGPVATLLRERRRAIRPRWRDRRGRRIALAQPPGAPCVLT